MSAHPPARNHTGLRRLLIGSATIALLWLVVLPWLAARPAMRSHTRWLDEQGIDPSAMYYTDLPLMDRVLERLEGRTMPNTDSATTER